MASFRSRQLGDRNRDQRLQDSVLEPAASLHRTHQLQHLSSSIREVPSVTGGSARNAGKVGNRRNRPDTSRPRLLFSNFRGSESIGRMETSYRSERPEPLHSLSVIQDGDHLVRPSSHQEGRLDGINRPQGRLLPCSDAPTIQEIPPILLPKQDLAIPGPSVWTEHGSESFHKNGSTSSCFTSSSRHSFSSLSGRLVDQTPEVSRPTATNCPDYRSSGQVRLDYKPEEVRPEANTVCNLPGNSNRLNQDEGLPNRTTTRQPDKPDDSLSSVRQSPIKVVAITPGTPVISSHLGSGGQVKNASTTTEPGSFLLTQHGHSGERPSSAAVDSCPPVVVLRIEHQSRRRPRPYSSSRYGFYRRVKRRLGSTCPAVPSIGNLDRGGERTAHQSPRTESSVERLPTPGRSILRPQSNDNVRQLDSSRLSYETRGDTIRTTVHPHRRDPGQTRGPEDSARSSPYPRTTERAGRYSQQEVNHSPNRMVPSSRSLQEDKQPVGTSSSRPVCDQPERSAASVRVPIPGGSSLEDGRLLHSVDRDPKLRLPPDIVGASSHQQDPGRPGRSNLSSTSMAKSRLVERPSRTVHRPAKKSSTLAETPVSNSQRKKSVPSQPSAVQASRLEIIRNSLEGRGFSEKTAALISQPNKKSSSKLYQAKWTKFTLWADSHGIVPVHATVPDLADFFTELFDKGLSISTIKGYRSSISRVLRTRGTDVSNNKDLSDLMLAFEQQRPVAHREVPKWDLSLVLGSFTKVPFEPLTTSSLKNLTLKTCFLLSLATAKRVSEIQAFSNIICHSEDWSSITLTFDPSFIAKTQRPGDHSSALSPVTIPSLEHTLSPDLADVSLCPVRAVREYLSKTEGLRDKNSKRLFISFQPGRNKDVSKNTIAYWLKTTIKSAYSSANRWDVSLHQVKPHEIRALSTSLVFSRNLNIKEVMDAASWRGESTFARFYLRDATHRFMDLKSLGPIVAAQSLVS